MTLTLEISPEVERELISKSQISGLAMEAVAASWIGREKQRQRAE